MTEATSVDSVRADSQQAVDDSGTPVPSEVEQAEQSEVVARRTWSGGPATPATQLPELEQRNQAKRKAEEDSDEELTIKLDPSPSKRPHLQRFNSLPTRGKTGSPSKTNPRAKGLERRLEQLKQAANGEPVSSADSTPEHADQRIVADRCGALHLATRLREIEDFLLRGSPLVSSARKAREASSSQSSSAAYTWPCTQPRPLFSLRLTASPRHSSDLSDSAAGSGNACSPILAAPPVSPLGSDNRSDIWSRDSDSEDMDLASELYVRMQSLALQQAEAWRLDRCL